MAEASIPVEENYFQCPICIELLKDPVCIPCGHTYCMDCIKKCWDHEEEGNVYSCPQCRQTFNPRPGLGRNPILADLVAKLKATGLQNAAEDAEFAGPGDVECTICIGRKRKADKSCLDCQDSYCAVHFYRHEELLAGKRHNVVEATAELRSKMCLDHGKPLEGFCETDEKCVCFVCIIDEHKGHDIVSLEQGKQNHRLKLKGQLQTEINKRETEQTKIADNVDCVKLCAQASSETMENGFTEVMAFFEQKRAEVAKMFQAKEQDELSCTAQLQEDIRMLRVKTDDLECLGNEQDDIHFLQNPPLVSPDDLPSFVDKEKYSFDRLALESYWKVMMENLKKVCDENVGHIWRQVNFRFFPSSTLTKTEWINRSCKLELDEDTAFRHHKIDEDCKTVKWSKNVVSKGYSWRRFTECRQVLCKTAAPQVAYWWVTWKSKSGSEVSIAVAYSIIPRKGNGKDCRFGRNEDSWCLERSRSGLSFLHNDCETKIAALSPSTVGVYFNQKEGDLMFYNLDHDKPKCIFGIHGKFTKSLYPGFYVTASSSVTIS